MTGVPNRYNSVVERHLQRAYPKLRDNTSSTTDAKDLFYNDTTSNPNNDRDAMHCDQAEALVLWLTATSTAPANPFEGFTTGSPTVPRNVFFEFDQRRLVDADGDGLFTFQPRHCRDTDYIYMEARTYTTYVKDTQYARSGDTGPQNVVPYGTGPTTPVNPNRFQIVCAGLDGDFGALTTPASGLYPVKVFPIGTNYMPGDKDNLTNFSGGTLGDARPQ
jgi:hypothetical protein